MFNDIQISFNESNLSYKDSNTIIFRKTFPEGNFHL